MFWLLVVVAAGDQFAAAVGVLGVVSLRRTFT
jgi:hypothetical protein